MYFSSQNRIELQFQPTVSSTTTNWLWIQTLRRSSGIWRLSTNANIWSIVKISTNYSICDLGPKQTPLFASNHCEWLWSVYIYTVTARISNTGTANCVTHSPIIKPTRFPGLFLHKSRRTFEIDGHRGREVGTWSTHRGTKEVVFRTVFPQALARVIPRFGKRSLMWVLRVD